VIGGIASSGLTLRPRLRLLWRTGFTAIMPCVLRRLRPSVLQLRLRPAYYGDYVGLLCSVYYGPTGIAVIRSRISDYYGLGTIAGIAIVGDRQRRP